MVSLLLRDFPSTWGDHDLKNLFGEYGRVLRVVFVFDRACENARYAFVDMACPDAARQASLGLNGRRIHRHELRIEPFVPV